MVEGAFTVGVGSTQACCNAGGRKTIHLYIFIEHWFQQAEFYLSFVQKFNNLFINLATVPADRNSNSRPT